MKLKLKIKLRTPEMYDIVCSNCGRTYEIAYRRRINGHDKWFKDAKSDPQTSQLFLDGWAFIPEDRAQQCFRKNHRLKVKKLKESQRGLHGYTNDFTERGSDSDHK